MTDILNHLATLNKFALSEKHQVYVDNIDSGKRWIIADTVGKPVAKWDMRENEFYYRYDELQRLTDTIVNGACVERLQYGTSGIHNNIGRLEYSYNQSGRTHYKEYDFKGNVLYQNVLFCRNYIEINNLHGDPPLEDDLFMQYFTYDALNRPVTVTQPDSTVVTDIYDKGGRLKSIRRGAMYCVSNITYNPRGQRENIYYGNNTKTSYEYNFCPNPAPNAMQNYTQHYQYDALGNMLQMQSAGNWTRNYEYNNPMNNNYLLGHGNGTVYSYDAHGNMLTMPHLSSMSYDYQDQLIRAGNGTFASYYNYDAAGNRTRKVVEKNNIIETRYYINGYEVYRKEVNGVVEVERKTINISDDEKVFVRIETKTGENPVIRYQYDNHLGSACLELDDGGQIISYEEYHPFGTTSYRSGRTETEVSLKRYKYCGKERDEETGLYYYGMRYYAAWLCRFVSVDPLQFRYPYYTPYQYAGNKPVSYIDLDGGEPKEPQKQSNYVVQKGDTPSSIAEKAGISIWDLAKWNQGQQEGGGYFSNIGKGDYQEYWVKGKGTSWSIKPGDVLNIVGGKESTSTTNANYNSPKYFIGYPRDGGITPVYPELFFLPLPKLGLLSKLATWAGKALFKSSSRVVTEAATNVLVKEGVNIATKTETTVGKDIFIVTKEGVALPKGAKIPSEFIQNPYRSSSYGIFKNGKFVEKLRIDPATEPGFKGPNYSHFHLNGNGKHSTNWLWWKK